MELSAFLEQRWDVFLSYAADCDEGLVLDLVRALRVRGLSVWYDRIDSLVHEGEHIADDELESMLQAALGSCHECVVLTTESFFSRQWPLVELRHISHRCRNADMGVAIVRDRPADQIRSQLISHGFDDLVNRVEIMEPHMQAGTLAERIMSRFKKRTLMSLHKVAGPLDVCVFPDAGYICLFPGGGLEKPSQLQVWDFSGNTISHLKFKRGSERLSIEFARAKEGTLTLTGLPTHFDDDALLGLLNHLHMRAVSEQEVSDGIALNFGTNESPLVCRPFFTCSSCTLGPVSDALDPYLAECLKIAEGSYEGDWRRIVVSGGRFSVQGSA